MGTGYQARQAMGSRSDKLRADKVRHTLTMTVGLFEAMRSGALANNRSVSEEMVARLGASIDPVRDRGERVAILAAAINRSGHCDWKPETCRAGICQCKALADEAIDALERHADRGKGVAGG